MSASLRSAPDAASGHVPTPRTVRAPGRLARYRHEIMLAILLCALWVAAGIVSPGFLTFDTQRELFTHSWELAILTIPMMLIILTGGIDLSVGSTMALSSVAFGLAFDHHYGIAGASLVAILTGCACGYVNGFCITRFRIHPLIVTLATLSAYRGIAEGVSLGRSVSGFSDGFNLLATGAIAGIPVPGIVYVVGCIGTAIVMSRTVFGKRIVAIGYNETAARFAAIRVDRIKIQLYLFSGFAAGCATLLFAARRNTAKADVGVGMELDVITAVVLGGTSIFGGQGGVVGTVLGVLLLHESREWMSWAFDRDELNMMLVGGLLIASVLLQRMLSGKTVRET